MVAVLKISEVVCGDLADTGSAVIERRCHLGHRASVLNVAQAARRRRGHGRGHRRRAFGQASEMKYDKEEARREADTLARKAEIEECWPLVHPNILQICTWEVPGIYLTSKCRFHTETKELLRNYANCMSCLPHQSPNVHAVLWREPDCSAHVFYESLPSR